VYHRRHDFSANQWQRIKGRLNATLCTLNPCGAHLLRPSERLLAYPWSSLGYYLAAPEHRPQWVRVDRLLGEHGLQQDTSAARQEFERRMEARRLESGDQQGLKALRRGLVPGQSKSTNIRLHTIMSQTAPAQPIQYPPRSMKFMKQNEPCYGLTTHGWQRRQKD
jgi:hypothetical protein